MTTTNFTIFNLIEMLDNPSASMGYPIYFICVDGRVLSEEAVNEQRPQIIDAMNDSGSNNQWQVVGYEINFEDNSLYCDHTGKLIPSAYGED